MYRLGTWLALLFAFPAAALVRRGTSVTIFVALVIGVGVLDGTVYGPLAAFWAESFDTRVRYTALGALYQLSGIVASGLTPLIAAWLVALRGGDLWWLAAYNVAVAIVSLLSARALPETLGRDLESTPRSPVLDGAVR
ncbi:hypothetical protein [Kribbella deserti]|uniref:MFS transporter n=1 Tax=Kribbella deserti TaxID=1926257 RepID=A0ABV6QNW6_9ACTN